MFKKKKVFQSTSWNPKTVVNSIKTAEIFFLSKKKAEKEREKKKQKKKKNQNALSRNET